MRFNVRSDGRDEHYFSELVWDEVGPAYKATLTVSGLVTAICSLSLFADFRELGRSYDCGTA
jgi:hypothetical protein